MVNNQNCAKLGGGGGGGGMKFGIKNAMPPTDRQLKSIRSLAKIGCRQHSQGIFVFRPYVLFVEKKVDFFLNLIHRGAKQIKRGAKLFIA